MVSNEHEGENSKKLKQIVNGLREMQEMCFETVFQILIRILIMFIGRKAKMVTKI